MRIDNIEGVYFREEKKAKETGESDCFSRLFSVCYAIEVHFEGVLGIVVNISRWYNINERITIFIFYLCYNENTKDKQM